MRTTAKTKYRRGLLLNFEIANAVSIKLARLESIRIGTLERVKKIGARGKVRPTPSHNNGESNTPPARASTRKICNCLSRSDGSIEPLASSLNGMQRNRHLRIRKVQN